MMPHTKSQRQLLVLTDVLRLTDNPLLLHATGSAFLAVAILDNRQFSASRASARRRALQQSLLLEAQDRFARAGLPLLIVAGNSRDLILSLCRQYQLNRVVIAEPVGPDEYQDLAALPADIQVQQIDANSLLAEQLRPDLTKLPRSFTAFRQAREPDLTVCSPLIPDAVDIKALSQHSILSVAAAVAGSTLPLPSESLPLDQALPSADLASLLQPGYGRLSSVAEPGAIQRFLQYLPYGSRHYKQSRNALIGADFASYLSLPLARGTLSVRWVWQTICDYEQQHGVSESSYWLKFELLWREYFRHLLRKHQQAFFCYQGIGRHPVQPIAANSPATLSRWQQGQTTVPLVDASMQLLQHSGWLSNRARQNVASYLHFDLGCDWRQGAAWFEYQLLDYDVASNWGNWAYIVGALDSAPRRFNLMKQSEQYDPGLLQCQRILQAITSAQRRCS